MSKPIDVTDATYQSEVIDADKTVLVDFWAPWCGPCRNVSPILEEIAQERSDQLQVVKINIDDNPMTPARYGVTGIPTMTLFKGGQPVASIVGAQPKQRIVRELEPHLG